MAALTLLALAHGEDAKYEQLPRLLAQHIASLYFIVQDWTNATGIEKEKLLKRWAHGIFPAANQPYGAPYKVLSAF